MPDHDRAEAWRIATPIAERWINETYPPDTGVPVRIAQLGYRHPSLGWVDWPDRNSVRQPLSVSVAADLDGFLVNPYDGTAAARFGAEFIRILPAGPRCGGIFVPHGRHPSEPGWADDTRPRLLAAIETARGHVQAYIDDRLCRAPHWLHGEHPDWECMRVAGHETGPAETRLHAMEPGRLWTVAGVRAR